MIDNDSVVVKASAIALFASAKGIPARGGTVYTGDTIQGALVISQLDVNSKSAAHESSMRGRSQ
jgi:hypothetical protein